MSMKFLAKVTAGVVLGGASLLIGAPGIAMASAHGGYDHAYTKDDYKKNDYKKDHYKKDDYKKDDHKKDCYKKDDYKKDDHKKDDYKKDHYKKDHCSKAPHGWVHAGDGGAAPGGNGGLVAGVGMLAASVIGGAALWRRRMADGTSR
ncbi:MAG: hypothetical protein QOE61_2961 [Micromonosporaceae bacterium]|jgi:hypothetical protein|nr:hypothetical protein [Micromonosporaceae bacterium]